MNSSHVKRIEDGSKYFELVKYCTEMHRNNTSSMGRGEGRKVGVSELEEMITKSAFECVNMSRKKKNISTE